MRSERRFFIPFLAGLTLVLGVSPGDASSAPSAAAAVAVSPGSASKVAVIGDGCPTFSWGAAPGARSYELVVYRLAEEGEEAQPVLRETLAGSASSWTPSLDRCLERGGRYAWSVRAVGGKEASEWSALSLFQVASRPSEAEFEEAFEVVKSYLALRGEDAASAPRELNGSSQQEGPASSEAPAPLAPAAETQLSVDGNIAATSYTGDGENLANVATDAELATHTGLADAHREHATLEESSEIDADILAHKGLPSDHHTPTVDTDTVLTESQVEAFVTNGPLDGSQLTNLNAGNLTTGTVAEARIADEMARDSEVLSIVLGDLECPGAAGSTDRYTDCGNGTVRDNNTGLIWLKDATCADLEGLNTEARGTWDTAQSAAAALSDGTCGLTDGSVAGDWRQPTVSEFCSAWSNSPLYPCPPGAASDSLIDSSLSGDPFVTNAAGTGLWAEGDAFVGVQMGGWYWSATEGAPGFAWIGNLEGAGVSESGLMDFGAVWPVRSGASLATLEESSEIDADILAHKSLPDDHHTATVDTDTVLTESQVETFVTNGPLDGSQLTNLNAGNLTTGTVAEARIADEMARDSEVLSIVLDDLASCPGAGGSTARYTDCGNGTVRDNNMGLIWLKDASCADLGPNGNGTGAWDEAQSAAAALADGTCGLTDGSQAGDWRQPTIEELCSAWSGGNLSPCPSAAASDSLIDSSLSGAPFVSNAAGTGLWSEGDPFVGVQSAFYWSATERDAVNAWIVNLTSGHVFGDGKADSSDYVWPVRSGATPSLAAVEESSEIDADILAHKSLPDDHHILPTSLPPSGAAGGELAGSYPNPTVAAAIARDAEVSAAVTAHKNLAGDHHAPTLDTDTFVTNLDAHDHQGGDGAAVPHSSLGSVGADDHHARYTDAEVNALIAAQFDAEAACAGAGGSTARYTDCGNGTVRDNNTGLIWLKDASCADLAGTDSSGRGTWSTAQAAAAALSDGTCGLTDGSVATDWRQPTISELCSAWAGSALFPCPSGAASDSLIDSSLGAPYVSNAAGTGLWSEGDPFVGVQSNYYWSATEDGAPTGHTWLVLLANGVVSTGGGTFTSYVWPVRSGQ